MPKIFISYRRDDTGVSAGRLAADLRRDFEEQNVFFDLDRKINAEGTKWIKNIDRAISNAHIALVIIGDKWIKIMRASKVNPARDIVRYEISALLKRGAIVVPVRVDNAELPATDELEPEITDLLSRGAFRLTQWNWDNDYAVIRDYVKRSQSFSQRPIEYLQRVTCSKMAWLFAVLALLSIPIVDLSAKYIIFSYYRFTIDGKDLNLLDRLEDACAKLNRRLDAYGLPNVTCYE